MSKIWSFMLKTLMDAPLRHRAAIAEAERLLRSRGHEAAHIALSASKLPDLKEEEREHLRRVARIAALRLEKRSRRERKYDGLGR